MRSTGWWQFWLDRLRLLKREAHALLLASQDTRTPWYAKFLAGLVVAYAFSPIDLIPDFIPVLGFLDDLIVVPFGVVLVRHLIPAEVMNECRIRAALASETGKTVVGAGAVVVVIIWIAFIFLVYLLIRGWWAGSM